MGEKGKQIGDNPCKPNDKEWIKSKRGFSILKEPQWKKFNSGNVRFCRIVIYGNNHINLISAAPDVQQLAENEKPSRQNSYYEDVDEDDDDDTLLVQNRIQKL